MDSAEVSARGGEAVPAAANDVPVREESLAGEARRADDLAFQRRMLSLVSRTFALTIPQLPDRLADVVSNAYLLCRIADTIEDEPAMAAEAKLHYAKMFVRVVAGEAPADEFAYSLAPVLAEGIPAAERELIAECPSVLRITHGFTEAEREALVRCVRIMSDGMAEFQLNASPGGLADVKELDRYCYHVAGVVGEMLTTLFCEHSPLIAAKRETLMSLSVSFGQGLQMTNILKDIWEDLERGACWLPRSHFAEFDFPLNRLPDLVRREGANFSDDGFAQGLDELVGIAHAHLEAALEYTLLIPSEEPGIRRFCLWALGMALLTLQKVHRHLEFRSSSDVKISRSAVRATVVTTSALVRQDLFLRGLFRAAALGLPHPP